MGRVVRLGDTGTGRELLSRRCYILSDGVSHKRFCSALKIPEENPKLKREATFNRYNCIHNPRSAIDVLLDHAR